MKNSLLKMLVLPLVAAGCGPTWVVVKQANPNPLSGKKAFAVEALAWEKMSIGSREKDRMSLADYVAKKKPEEQEKWKADFAKDQEGAGEKFKEVLASKTKGAGLDTAAGAGPETFTIKPSVRVYEPGFWTPMGWGNRATELHTTVEIVDGSGAVVDEVQFMSVIQPGTFNPSTGQRIRQAAEEWAAQLSNYLAGRTK